LIIIVLFVFYVFSFQAENKKRKLQQALKTMRSQKSEIDSLQLQLTQSAQKIRSSVERELRETFQAVKDERDQCRDQIINLECVAKDTSRKLSELSEELMQEKEELQLACSHVEELKLELSEKNSLITLEADKIAVLERQLDAKSHRCNDLEREINSTRQKLEQQARSKKVAATQTLPDSDITDRDNRIACLEETLSVAERRLKDTQDHLMRTAQERDSLRGQLSDITESNAAMNLKLDHSSVTISNLELNLKQSADNISRLERTISEKEKRNQVVEQSANEMKSTVNSLMGENALLKQHQADIDKLNSLVSSLEQKNSELTAQVCSLTEELQAKTVNDREILLQKDEVIAQLQLDLEAERRENRQRQKDEAELAHADGSVCKQESNVGEASKSVILDRLKKQHEAELHELEHRCCELASQVDSLKRELRASEISHEEKVSKHEEKIADLTLRLSSAERRACRMEQTRIASNSKTVECGVQTSTETLAHPFNVSSQMQMPVATGDSTLLPKVLQGSDTAGDARQPVGSEGQQLITALQSRVYVLEQELEKSYSGKMMNGHDEKLVSMFVVTYLVLDLL